MKGDKIDGLNTAEGRSISSRFPLGTDGAPFCGDSKGSEKYPGAEYRWNCTRPTDHEGPHVAHTPEGLAAALWYGSEVVN